MKSVLPSEVSSQPSSNLLFSFRPRRRDKFLWLPLLQSVDRQVICSNGDIGPLTLTFLEPWPTTG